MNDETKSRDGDRDGIDRGGTGARGVQAHDDNGRADHSGGGRNSATTATVATILAEVRDTAPMAGREHIAEMIRVRLDRAGIELPDDEIDELATQVTEGHE